MTTGMSAPPMGITAMMPNSRDSAMMAYSHWLFSGCRQNITALARIASTSRLLTICWPLNVTAPLPIFSLSLP